MAKTLTILPFLVLVFACQPDASLQPAPVKILSDTATSLVILGTTQDGGWPHIGCRKTCCDSIQKAGLPPGKVVALGLCDPLHQQTFLFEATPDITSQLSAFMSSLPFRQTSTPTGIFLTHAHIGHYSGLMYLGREALNADAVPVYAMPAMTQFLQNNGPWNQLLRLNNIQLQTLKADSSVFLNKALTVIPLRVPHRDEYSETVGFVIKGKYKSALFIPDIDKWNRWDRSIEQLIHEVDYAFLDATFFDGAEIKHRAMSEIPHPFVVESLKRFEGLPLSDKQKIYFIHFNHSNPLLYEHSVQTKQVKKAGYHVAREGMCFTL